MLHAPLCEYWRPKERDCPIQTINFSLLCVFSYKRWKRCRHGKSAAGTVGSVFIHLEARAHWSCYRQRHHAVAKGSICRGYALPDGLSARGSFAEFPANATRAISRRHRHDSPPENHWRTPSAAPPRLPIAGPPSASGRSSDYARSSASRRGSLRRGSGDGYRRG